LTAAPEPQPYVQAPKPYPKPELPPSREVRESAGGIGKGNEQKPVIKPENVKTASISEDAEKEPVIRDILEIFDGEVLNRK